LRPALLQKSFHVLEAHDPAMHLVDFAKVPGNETQARCPGLRL